MEHFLPVLLGSKRVIIFVCLIPSGDRNAKVYMFVRANRVQGESKATYECAGVEAKREQCRGSKPGVQTSISLCHLPLSSGHSH